MAETLKNLREKLSGYLIGVPSPKKLGASAAARFAEGLGVYTFDPDAALFKRFLNTANDYFEGLEDPFLRYQFNVPDGSGGYRWVEMSAAELLDIQNDAGPARQELEAIINDLKAEQILVDEFVLSQSDISQPIEREDNSPLYYWSRGVVTDYMYPRATISNWPWFVDNNYGNTPADFYPWTGDANVMARGFPRPIVRQDPFVLGPKIFKKHEFPNERILAYLGRMKNAITRYLEASNVDERFCSAVFLSRKPVNIRDLLVMDNDYRGFRASLRPEYISDGRGYNNEAYAWLSGMGLNRGDYDDLVSVENRITSGLDINGNRAEPYEVSGTRFVGWGWQSMYRMNFRGYFRFNPDTGDIQANGTDYIAYMKSLTNRRKLMFKQAVGINLFEHMMDTGSINVDFADAVYDFYSMAVLTWFLSTVPPHALLMSALQMHRCCITKGYLQLGLNFGEDLSQYINAIERENEARRSRAVQNETFVRENGFALTAALTNPSDQTPRDSIVGSNTSFLPAAAAGMFMNPGVSIVGIGLSYVAGYLAFLASSRAPLIRRDKIVLTDSPGSFFESNNIYPGFTAYNTINATPVKRIPR